LSEGTFKCPSANRDGLTSCVGSEVDFQFSREEILYRKKTKLLGEARSKIKHKYVLLPLLLTILSRHSDAKRHMTTAWSSRGSGKPSQQRQVREKSGLIPATHQSHVPATAT